MQSLFRKISIGQRDSLPVRKVHSKLDESPPPVAQLDPRKILLSVEKRLASLGQQLDQKYKEQFAKGLEVGRQEGYQAGRKEAGDLVASAAAELSGIREQRETHFREHKQQIVDLIYTICKKLLLEQIADPANILHLVEDALRVLQPTLEAMVFCHPDRVQELRSVLGTSGEEARGKIEIIADPLLPPHALRVESNHSVLELDLVNELKAIAREMGAELGI